MFPKILALDVGGSKALSAIATVTEVNGSRRVELSGIARRPLKKDSGREGIWVAILSLVPETMEKTGAIWDDVVSIGATIPGIADPKRGYWIYAPFSGVRDFPIADELRARYGKPVFGDNDVNACVGRRSLAFVRTLKFSRSQATVLAAVLFLMARSTLENMLARQRSGIVTS